MSNSEKSPGTNALLGDLESIRALLDQNARERTPADGHGARQDAGSGHSGDLPDTDDSEVPLLEDVVSGTAHLHERPGDESEIFGTASATAGAAAGLNDDIFKALLSDEWRDSASELLDEARSAIEQHQNAWTPEHTDELNAALKVRIDATLHRWLRETVLSQLDDLRLELLAAVKQQIRETTQAQLNPPPEREDPHGE